MSRNNFQWHLEISWYNIIYQTDNNTLEDLICPTLCPGCQPASLPLSRPETGEPGRQEIAPRSGRLEEEEKERVSGALAD